MEEYMIKDISNTRIEFNTLNKDKVVEVFNYHCKSLYQININELTIIDDKLCLPIDLSKWFDIDNELDFDIVLEALKRITDPKMANAAITLKAKLVGYDNDLNQNFVFADNYYKGKHVVVGKYDDGTKLIFIDKLYKK
ncbi:MAG: hypothetical protein LUH02_04495 [Erysipelotrichaceae bacterium]|nr:hypothetical protein [Erysipelotrichaceae bacterium]